MSEPMLCKTSVKDSFDVMMEMKMYDLLQHPIVVEVINLVYEGEYSVDSSIISTSLTFSSLFNSEMFSIKSINDRIIENIKSVGASN